MTTKTDRPRGWPLGPATVRAVLSGHGILGLSFAAVIYLVCLTGTLAVFVHDIERWQQPSAPAVTQLSEPALVKAVEAARVAAPADTTLYVGLPSPTEAASIIAYSPTFEREWAIDQDGSLVDHAAAFADFILNLHISLHLPRTWGEFIVGLAGVALLSSLVSGILAHPRVFKDAFHLRLGGSLRLQEADLHNRLGIWALPFHVVIALTGALLGLSTLIVGVLAMLLYRGDTAKVYGLFVDAPPAVNAAAAPLPPLGALIAQARSRAAGGEPHQLMIERAGRADARITITSEQERLLVPQDITVFDAQGKVVKDQHPQDTVAGTRILGGIGQLHFGWFGGVPVRIAYGLLGFALCFVTSTGVTIWLARRRDKGRPVPKWERLWTAVIWGQPVAITLAALLGVASAASEGALAATWAALTLVSLAASSWIERPRVAVGLKATLALSMLGLAAIHVALHGASNATSIVIDLLLLLTAVMLLMPLWKARARTA